jgi:hypothetical protein
VEKILAFLGLGERRWPLVWIAGLYLAGTGALIYLFFPTGWSALWGQGDTEVAEHLSFLTQRLFSFFPFPLLNMQSDLVFYPYGIGVGMQAWAPERAFFGALLTTAFGHGPWMQIYALGSFLIAGVGAFLLLVRPYGFLRASTTGLALSFLSFYAVLKFPGHHNLIATHWTVLSILVDFLIFKKLTEKSEVSLLLLQLRGLLLFLSLGLDLSYVAGYGLTSFVVTSVFVVWELRRKKIFRSSLIQLVGQWQTNRGLHWALLLASLVAAWLYVPFCAQLLLASGGQRFRTMTWWANPVRWLIPWLPGWNPGTLDLQRWLGDRPEGIADASPGWSLLLPAIAGWWFLKRTNRVYWPLWTLTALVALHHPANFPVLRIFPWASMNRVGGRGTLVLPVIFLLFALAIPWQRLGAGLRKSLLAGWLVLAVVEAVTCYRWVPRDELAQMSAPVRDFIAAIQNSPGEAVLDWPFCVLSGNAVTTALCPDLGAAGDYAFQRFHGKKVIGLNFGRLSKQMVKPYLQNGWPRLLQAGGCFSSEQWKFFDDFFSLNDFAGIILHRSAVPDECALQFHQRYGPPAVATDFPGHRPVEFFPKPRALQGRVNPALGKALFYGLEAEFPLDLSDRASASAVDLEGLGMDRGSVVLGKEQGALSFFTTSKQPLRIEGTLETIRPGIRVQIEVGGEIVFSGESEHSKKFSAPIPTVAGRNEISFRVQGGESWWQCWKEFTADGKNSVIRQLNAFTIYCQERRNHPAQIKNLRILSYSKTEPLSPSTLRYSSKK